MTLHKNGSLVSGTVEQQVRMHKWYFELFVLIGNIYNQCLLLVPYLISHIDHRYRSTKYTMHCKEWMMRHLRITKCNEVLHDGWKTGEIT